MRTVLPPTITIHMSPYAEEDQLYYQTHGVPKPNPNFPPTSDPLYIFQTLWKGAQNQKNWRQNYHDHYPRSRWLFKTRCGSPEYYLSGYDSLEEDIGWAPEREIRLPHVRIENNRLAWDGNDNTWKSPEEWKPTEGEDKRTWTCWENLAHLDF